MLKKGLSDNLQSRIGDLQTAGKGILRDFKDTPVETLWDCGYSTKKWTPSQNPLSFHPTKTTGVPQGSVLGPFLFSLYTHGDIIYSHGLSCYAFLNFANAVITPTQENLVTSDKDLSFLSHINNQNQNHVYWTGT